MSINHLSQDIFEYSSPGIRDRQIRLTDSSPKLYIPTIHSKLVAQVYHRIDKIPAQFAPAPVPTQRETS